MDYKTIIAEIFEVYNINASEFAEKINVQRSSISHILSGRNKPSLDFLIKVKDAFPELRWDYLVLGKKPMTKSENDVIEKQKVKSDEENNDLSPTLFSALKEEEKPIYHTQKTTTKTIEKIIWFYNDNTFEVFTKDNL